MRRHPENLPVLDAVIGIIAPSAMLTLKQLMSGIHPQHDVDSGLQEVLGCTNLADGV